MQPSRTGQMKMFVGPPHDDTGDLRHPHVPLTSAPKRDKVEISG